MPSNHASMIEGIKASRAERHIFRHNDPEDLDRKLRLVEPGKPKLVAFESVYSMDGDIAPIGEICDVAEAHGALTYLDEVHAVGSLRGARRRHLGAHGPRPPPRRDRGHAGQGLRGAWRLHHRLGEKLCDFVRSFASGFIFTTSLPPAVAAGAAASIRHLKRSGAERARHQERVASGCASGSMPPASPTCRTTATSCR